MKGALIVGIDNYSGKQQLQGCGNDADSLAELLEANGDGSKNFDVELKKNVRSRAELRALLSKLFNADLDKVLFYFAGHGLDTDRGAFLVTPDGIKNDEGVKMDEILELANASNIKDKIIIIDCCYAGNIGNPSMTGGKHAYLGEGVTILTGARPKELSVESDGHGIFTSLLLNALKGGAADLTGKITMGSIYAYIDRFLNFLQQRPQFKTNVNRFDPVRSVKPSIAITEVLQKITTYFNQPDSYFPLDETYEYTNVHVAIPHNIAVFKNLQKMQSVGLVEPVDEEFMYWAAQNSKGCKLTTLGMHYWKLVKGKKI